MRPAQAIEIGKATHWYAYKWYDGNTLLVFHAKSKVGNTGGVRGRSHRNVEPPDKTKAKLRSLEAVWKGYKDSKIEMSVRFLICETGDWYGHFTF